MSELKTLKDMLSPSIGLGPVPPGQHFPVGERNEILVEIKEAAAEWVLALKDALAEGLVEEHIMKCNAKIEWIKHFFNLEDDD